MNEIHLHRGRHPHMTIIEAYVNGQLLTEAVVRSRSSDQAGCVLIMPPREGRRSHRIDADWLDGLLAFRWRSHRSSFGSIARPDPYQPSLPLLPTRTFAPRRFHTAQGAPSYLSMLRRCDEAPYRFLPRLARRLKSRSMVAKSVSSSPANQYTSLCRLTPCPVWSLCLHTTRRAPRSTTAG